MRSRPDSNVRSAVVVVGGDLAIVDAVEDVGAQGPEAGEAEEQMAATSNLSMLTIRPPSRRYPNRNAVANLR